MSDKLTIVIPTCSGPPLLNHWEVHNAKLWKPQADELIIGEDGQYLKELHELADVYILHPNIGVCANMNMAWQLALARGADYVAIMDSDVTWVEGNLRDMCIPGKIAVPRVIQHPDTAFIAPMLVVPKEVAQERGIYPCNRDYRNDGFDGVYSNRVKDLVEQVKSVRIDHEGGATRFGNLKGI